MSWFFLKAALLAAPCAVFLLELAVLRLTVRPGRRLMLAVAGFGLVASCKFFAFRYFGGDAFNPDLPMWLIVLWGCLESVIWVAFPVTLVALPFAWAVRPFRRVAFGTVALVSAAVALWGMWEGVRVPPVVEREAAVEELPDEFDGYRLVHISDLHCSSAARRGKIAAIVARANAAKPDLVAITGDFVDGFPERRAGDLEPLGGLRARDGVVACTGNHECYFRIALWEPHYRRWGLEILRNRWKEIRRGEGRLVIGGIDDPAVGERADRVFHGAPTDGCRILLQHRPANCRRNGELLGARLQLSGHTHGGAMPVIARFVALDNEGHVRGFYREGRLLLHVSPGSGQWAGFPLRFFNPPEITVLTLRKKR